MTQDHAEKLKRLAAKHAVDLVENGMVLGLGHGSTTRHAVDIIGERVRSGALQNIIGVPTSEFTRNQAQTLGIQLQQQSAVIILPACYPVLRTDIKQDVITPYL